MSSVLNKEMDKTDEILEVLGISVVVLGFVSIIMYAIYEWFFGNYRQNEFREYFITNDSNV